jgi:hypothetical protein
VGQPRPIVGRTAPGLFGVVARPRQAERAPCTRAELGFDPVACLELENSFSIFHSVLNRIQTLKIVSKYPELQKL